MWAFRSTTPGLNPYHLGVHFIPLRCAFAMQSDLLEYACVEAPTIVPLRAVRRHRQPLVVE